jgi:hypothetical protein
MKDFFDKARLLAAALLIVGAALLMIGPILDWVSIEPPEVVPRSEEANTHPFSGLEAGTGWVALVAGVAILSNSALLLRLKVSSFAWLSLLAGVVAGGVTMADYRGLPDINSSLAERMEVVGALSPGIGMILCAAGAVLVLLGAAAGIAASPRSRIA